MSNDFEKLFLSEESSDVKIIIGREVIPAHKLILTARLPYFEKLFSSGMKEATTNEITFEDTDSETFKEFLRYVYCGKTLANFKDIADVMLPLAEKFGVQSLKNECMDALISCLKEDNLIDSLIVADLYQCSSLKNECKLLLAAAKKFMPLEALLPYPQLLLEVTYVFQERCLK